MNNKNITILGIDASSTNIGVAFYDEDRLKRTKNYEFKGKFDLEKLAKITQEIEDLISDAYPKLILIEEPIPLRGSKAMTALNQVAGAICAIAFVYRVKVQYIHNRTAKKAFGVTHKAMANKLIVNKYPRLEKVTEHELDAVLITEAYIKLNKEQ